MLIQKVNFNAINQAKPLVFKGREQKYSAIYSEKDVQKVSDPDKLLEMISALKANNSILNVQLANVNAQLKAAQVKYLYAKGERDELSKEKMELNGHISDSYNALTLAEKKYNDIVSGQYMKNEKAKQLKELQIKIDEIDSDDDVLSDIKAQIEKYIQILEG